MPWYGWLILACVVIGPFDALYVYIKSERRRDAIRRRKQARDTENERHE